MAKEFFDEYFEPTHALPKTTMRDPDTGSPVIDSVVRSSVTGAIDGVCLPRNTTVMVNTGFGDPKKRSAGTYVRSALERSVQRSRESKATPYAIVPLIKTSSDDTRLLDEIGTSIHDFALENRLAVINQEHLVVPDALQVDCDVSFAVIGGGNQDVLYGSMMTGIDLRDYLAGPIQTSESREDGTPYGAFDTNGREIISAMPLSVIEKMWAHSYAGYPENAAHELVALSDYAAEKGLDVVMVSGVAKCKRYPGKDIPELSGKIKKLLEDRVERLSNGKTIVARMNFEQAGARLADYAENKPVMILDGFVFGKLPLEVPVLQGAEAGDHAYAVQRYASPRVHGLSELEELYNAMLDSDAWDQTLMGEALLHDYFTRPTPTLCNVIHHLKRTNRLTGAYMTGEGGLDGSFARDLHDKGLYVGPSPLLPNAEHQYHIERAVAEGNVEGWDLRKLYGTLPVGVDAVFTVSSLNPDFVQKTLQGYGLRSRHLGRVQHANDKRGFEVQPIRGDTILFP